jgi:hypothetical protein
MQGEHERFVHVLRSLSGSSAVTSTSARALQRLQAEFPGVSAQEIRSGGARNVYEQTRGL